jgi:hypothetical protein
MTLAGTPPRAGDAEEIAMITLAKGSAAVAGVLAAAAASIVLVMHGHTGTGAASAASLTARSGGHRHHHGHHGAQGTTTTNDYAIAYDTVSGRWSNQVPLDSDCVSL